MRTKSSSFDTNQK